MPAERHIVVVCDGEICARTQSGRQCECDSSFKGVASDVHHFGANGFKALPFTLPDLDGEQLKKMPVAISGAGSRSFRSIEQSTRDVESHGARAGSRARGSIRGSYACSIYEGCCVCGKSAGVPGSVFSVGAEESDRRFSHVDRITLKSSARSSCGRSPAGDKTEISKSRLISRKPRNSSTGAIEPCSPQTRSAGWLRRRRAWRTSILRFPDKKAAGA